VASRAPTGSSGCLTGTKLIHRCLTAYMHAIANLSLFERDIYKKSRCSKLRNLGIDSDDDDNVQIGFPRSNVRIGHCRLLCLLAIPLFLYSPTPPPPHLHPHPHYPLLHP